MSFGYHGKILRVDLSSGQIDVQTPDDSFYRRYVGGGALATYFLLTELEKGADSLSPDNVLVFACSVATGTPAAGWTRFTVAAKSPLTGGFGESEAGGWWAPEFKRAGFDAVVFKGRAPRPVYLWVKDGEAELRDAACAWGKITGEAQEAIRADVGEPRARIAMIGPAGEKQIRYACVLNELKHANGRTGMGAVMGSKNLKAVAVRGTMEVPVADPAAVRRLVREYGDIYTPGVMTDLGTANNVLGLNASGMLPTRNFRQGEFEGAEKISGETMRDTVLVNRGTCFACQIRCKREVRVGEPWNVDPLYGGPEYETLGAFGSACGVDDLGAIAKANQICNQQGLDTISTGMSIAFAIECYENGLLTKADTDGLDLRFGNAAAMVTMVERIAAREGLGELLAGGTKRAAERIGRGAERYAMQVKGQELPMHEPRGKVGLGLGYAVSPTGADHIEGPHDPMFAAEGPKLQMMRAAGLIEPIPARELSSRKARQFYYMQNYWSMFNSLGMCNLVGEPIGQLSIGKIVGYVSAVTGWKSGTFDLLKLGERANAMSRVFNLREGFSAEDDWLPERLFEPLENGALEGQGIDREQFARARSTYYAMVGWDPETGVPSRAKLEELDITWAAAQLG